MAAIKLRMDEEERTTEQAAQLWLSRIAAYKSKGRVSPDSKNLRWPIEAFVYTFDQWMKTDQVEMGNRENEINDLLF